MGYFGGGMPPPKYPKHSFYGLAHAPQAYAITLSRYLINVTLTPNLNRDTLYIDA